MTRPSRLAWCAIVLYAVAWFLPVIEDGATLADGALPGWEAVMFAASASIEGYEGNVFLTALIRSTAWTNLVFVAASGVFLFRRQSARLLRCGAWALGVAAVLNTQWLFLAADELQMLRPGYYAWVAAFPLLALAAWQMASAPAASDTYAPSI